MPEEHPDWVRDVSGTLVPYQSPAAAKDEAIRDARIAREKAMRERGGLVAGRGKDIERER